jgi:hypothetical protein
MAGVEDDVLDRFFERLSKEKAINMAMIDGLREALVEGGLPKAESLVQLIVNNSGEPVT